MQKGIPDRNGGFRPVRLTREGGVRAFAYVQARFMRLMAANSGAITAEYTFLIAFISILAAIGMVILGDDIKVYFEDLATALDNASQPTPDPFAS
jgi:Flp pilus assembly pilin Flp